MSAYATRNLTAIVYLRRVQVNLSRLTLSPAHFTYARFVASSRLRLDLPTLDVLGYIARAWTGLLYFPGLLALLLGNLVVVRMDRDAQIESLTIKMFTLCLILQPFLHPAHARYWPTFAPLMALSAAFLLKQLTERSTATHAGNLPLFAIQWAYVAVFVTVVLVIAVF
jgi:hypothetical protein